MQKCIQCQKDFQPKFSTAKLCFSCWLKTKELPTKPEVPAKIITYEMVSQENFDKIKFHAQEILELCKNESPR
jgi:hypothetical protein